MSGLPWFKCYPRDFREGMTGLTVDERGAYATVLMLIYERGAPVPDDATWLAAQLWVSVKAWNKIRASLIVKRRLFAVNVNGVDSLMDERAANELAKTSDLCSARSEAGKAGGKRSASKRAEKSSENAAQNDGTPNSPATSNENSDLGQASASELVNQTPSNDQPDIQTIRIGSVVPPDGETTGGKPPRDPDGKAWDEAVVVLVSLGGMTEKDARGFFGKLLARNGLKPADMLGALGSAFATGTKDPQSYLTRAAAGIQGRRTTGPPKRVGFV